MSFDFTCVIACGNRNPGAYGSFAFPSSRIDLRQGLGTVGARLRATLKRQSMATCLINIGGTAFEVDQFLKRTNLKTRWVYRKGESPKIDQQDRPESSCCVVISDTAEEPIGFHVQEAVRFLAVRESELTEAVKCGADDLRLCFLYHRHAGLEQTVYLPPKLLLLAGKLDVGIEATTVQPPEA